MDLPFLRMHHLVVAEVEVLVDHNVPFVCNHNVINEITMYLFFQFRGHFLPVSLPLGNILLVILMHRVSFPQGFGVRNYLHIAFRLGMANLLTVNLWILRVLFFHMRDHLCPYLFPYSITPILGPVTPSASAAKKTKYR